jgi:pimeloyl-ACP methyl ester carboxylesterase
VLYRLGVRLISYDRPGYGGSTRQAGRSVVDAADDVAAIADHLGIDRFAVVGRSGGGPHALACSARLADRVVRTVVLVSVARPDVPDLDWFAGMTEDNVAEYTQADRDVGRLRESLRAKAAQTRRDPESLMANLEAQMTAPDRRVVSDRTHRRLITATYAEALRDGPHGWIDDVLALRTSWGFNLDGITSPVRLWHGADDNFSPVSHTRWLASQIPTAQMQVQSGAAHFGAVEILPEMLGWLASRPRPRTGGGR